MSDSYPSQIKSEIEKEAYRMFDLHVGFDRFKDDEGNLPKSFGHNDLLDAFRHAYTSGRVTQKAFDMQWVAQKFGDDHETGPDHPNHPREHRMDLWNNEIGRRFGDMYSKEDLAKALADEVNKALDGEESLLIGDMYDARVGKLKEDDPKLARADLLGPAGAAALTIKELSLTEDEVDDINEDIEEAVDAEFESYEPIAMTEQTPATNPGLLGEPELTTLIASIDENRAAEWRDISPELNEDLDNDLNSGPSMA